MKQLKNFNFKGICEFIRVKTDRVIPPHPGGDLPLAGTVSLHTKERKHILEAIRYIDLVIPEQSWNQKEADEADIDKCEIDIFVIGDDWKDRFDFLKPKCEVLYLPRTEEISTTKIKNDLQLAGK